MQPRPVGNPRRARTHLRLVWSQPAQDVARLDSSRPVTRRLHEAGSGSARGVREAIGRLAATSGLGATIGVTIAIFCFDGIAALLTGGALGTLAGLVVGMAHAVASGSHPD